jgi:hypothetical protein
VQGPLVAAPLDDPDAFLRSAEQLAALGVEHVHFRAAGPDMAGFARRVGDIVAERLTAIEPAAV